MKLKQRQNIFNVIINASSLVQHIIQIKNGIMKHVNVIVGILARVFVRIEGIADTSDIMYDEIISVMDIVSTKKRNTIARNVSINSDDKKVRYKIDCCISDTVLLVIILLLIITIICYHYAKHRSKQKGINTLTI